MTRASNSIPEYSPNPAVNAAVDQFRDSLNDASDDIVFPICRGNNTECKYPLGRGVVLEPVGMMHNKKTDRLVRVPGLAIARFCVANAAYSVHIVDWYPNGHLRSKSKLPLGMLGASATNELLDRAARHIRGGTYQNWATDTERFKTDIRVPMQHSNVTVKPKV